MMQDGMIEKQLWILLDVAIASVLTGFIGIEREVKDKPAGMRTNMIVGGVSALFVSLGYTLAEVFYQGPLKDHITVNPMRVIQAIIIGVAFIGGGTVLKIPQKEKVMNLSTAAALLYSVGIGVSVGAKQYILAVGMTVIGLIIDFALLKLERVINRHNKHKEHREE